MHEIAKLIEEYKEVPVDVLEGYVGIRWGLRPEPLRKMLEQLEKARLIEINEGKAKWLGAGLKFPMEIKTSKEKETRRRSESP